MSKKMLSSAIIFLLIALSCIFIGFRKHKAVQSQTLQQFETVSRKVSFHIYYPTALPKDFILNNASIEAYPNNEISFVIPNTTDSGKPLSFTEKPANVQSNLMATVNGLKATGWKITKVSINGIEANLAQDQVWKGDEMLLYTTKDNVDIQIFDNFGLSQLTQIAQSMK